MLDVVLDALLRLLACSMPLPLVALFAAGAYRRARRRAWREAQRQVDEAADFYVRYGYNLARSHQQHGRTDPAPPVEIAGIWHDGRAPFPDRVQLRCGEKLQWYRQERPGRFRAGRALCPPDLPPVNRTEP